MFMHHSGKPSTDPKSRRGWTSTDFSYFGLGSSILTNWIRATMTLLKVNEELYELKLGKRGPRARALDLQGQVTTRVFLKHSTKGIFWEQVEQPADVRAKQESAKRAGRPKSEFDYDAFVASIRAEHLTSKQMFARAVEFADVGRTRFYGEIFPRLKERLHFDETHETYSTEGSPPAIIPPREAKRL
jgi:hypothetical protein